MKEFKGQTVGIDGYCWLHQGVYSCSEDLANGKGIDKLVNYCKKKLDLIVECGVWPILVFDGNKLYMK